MTRTQFIAAYLVALAFIMVGLALWAVYGETIALISAFMLC